MTKMPLPYEKIDTYCLGYDTPVGRVMPYLQDVIRLRGIFVMTKISLNLLTSYEQEYDTLFTNLDIGYHKREGHFLSF